MWFAVASDVVLFGWCHCGFTPSVPSFSLMNMSATAGTIALPYGNYLAIVEENCLEGDCLAIRGVT